MIHNLITYTTLRTNRLKSDKNTLTMDKSPPKHLDIQSNQRTSIHQHVKVNRPNKLQQTFPRKTESTKLNAIMEQLDESYINGHYSKNNINHFAPLYESDDE